MQTRVQTIGTCKENSTTGGCNARITIREKGGKLMTRRLRGLAKERKIAYIPENLLEDLVIGYNIEIDKLELPDQYKLEFKSWPESGHKKEQLIVDLIDRRHDLIKARHIAESETKDEVKGKELLTLLDDCMPDFEGLWNEYDLSSRGDVSWNPVEGITKKYSKLLAEAAALFVADEVGSEVGGWLQ